MTFTIKTPEGTELTIKKSVKSGNLISPDSYKVNCAGKSATFTKGEEKKIGEWIINAWKDEIFGFIPSCASVYHIFENGAFTYDDTIVLYCTYELEGWKC